MRGATFAIVLAMVAVPALLAGCTGAAVGKGALMATAFEGRSVADGAAREWAPEAELAIVSAFELDAEARRELADELADGREELDEAERDGDLTEAEAHAQRRVLDFYDIVVTADGDDVGDGLAAAWMYGYLGPAGVYAVGISRGAVVFSDDSETVLDDLDLEDVASPLGDWSVDSDDAATAAALGDETFSALREQGNVIGQWTLRQGSAGAVWQGHLLQVAADDFVEVAVAVDADSGALLQDSVVDPTVDRLYQEAGSFGGSFGVDAAASATSGFTVDSAGHSLLAVDVRISPAPLQAASVTLTDPAGVQTSLTLQADTSDPRTAFEAGDWSFLTAMPGPYTFEIDVGASVRYQWEASWCTDGDPIVEVGELEACDHVFDEQAANGGETLSQPGRWPSPWPF